MIGYVSSLGPHLSHKPQGIIDLKRLIWDKSTNISALNLVLNDLTQTMRRLRSHVVPLKVNKKSISTIRGQIFHIQSFCLPRLTYKLTSGFQESTLTCQGHLDFFHFAVAMVSISNVSSPCWEALCRAIEGLTDTSSKHPGLVVNHKKYIDIIKC